MNQKTIFEKIGCEIIDDEPDLSDSDQIFQHTELLVIH